MKISIKELKVEHDGSEVLYVRDIGFIVKSETFSGAIKQCQKQQKAETKTDKQSIPIEQLMPALAQMLSEILRKSKGEKEDTEKIEVEKPPLEELKKEEKDA